MAFALAIRNTETEANQHMASATMMIVLASVILCGGFTTPMLQWLQIRYCLWLAGWLPGWLAGWLAVWLASWLASCLPVSACLSVCVVCVCLWCVYLGVCGVFIWVCVVCLSGCVWCVCLGVCAGCVWGGVVCMCVWCVCLVCLSGCV